MDTVTTRHEIGGGFIERDEKGYFIKAQTIDYELKKKYYSREFQKDSKSLGERVEKA